jgi:hypothetical protein
MKISTFLTSIVTVLFLSTTPVIGVGNCGCTSSCTDSELNKDANGYSARARIDWVMKNMRKSETDACHMVCGLEFPGVCGKCAPKSNQCKKSSGSSGGSSGGGSMCGCSSCTQSVVNRNARGHSVKNRINWLKRNHGISEERACGVVCGSEFSSVCGQQCNPNQCRGGGSSGGSGGSSGRALTVVTQNLFWWNLFNQRGGGNFFNVYKRQGLLDIYLFQECDDVNRIKNGLGFSNMQTKQLGSGLAIAWNGSRFTKLNDGLELVGHDNGNHPWSPLRYLAWVRLRDRSNGKIIFVANHHGPLAINTGGKFGPQDVANKIDGVINRAKGSGDIVILGGDMNADASSQTVRSLAGKGYRKRGGDWVDHIFTKSGFTSSSETTIIHGTGSDHRGVKTRFASF